MKQPKLPPESLLLASAFLVGLSFVWVLARGKKQRLLVPSLEAAAVMPVPDVAWPKPGRKIAFNYPRSDTHTHQGVDFGAPTGTPIYAARGGRITHVFSSVGRGFSGYGRLVVIEGEPTLATSRLWYMYSHMDQIYVTAGQYVQTGEQIGTVGRTCFREDDPTHLCGGSHLHFEVSPRAYPQHSEAWRYDPAQVLYAIATGVAPNTWVTT